jgi:hypothetical protein
MFFEQKSKSVLPDTVCMGKSTCTEIQKESTVSLNLCSSTVSKDKLLSLSLHVDVFNLPRKMLELMFFEIIQELYDNDNLT